MKETKLVPLAYNSDPETIIEIAKACYNGGARLFEFTTRGDFAYQVFEQLSEYCVGHLPELILGVGSVTNAAQANMYMEMGANFVVTPVLREDIAIVCNRKKVMWSPGCGSLSEICRAEELGCELVKLFPGGTYGPGMVKAILGPQPWTSIMPTGGVTGEYENLKGWFDAGAICVGMGSKLISKDIVKSRNFKKLEENVRDVLTIIQEF